jgi:hypothetical protein
LIEADGTSLLGPDAESKKSQVSEANLRIDGGAEASPPGITVAARSAVEVIHPSPLTRKRSAADLVGSVFCFRWPDELVRLGRRKKKTAALEWVG